MTYQIALQPDSEAAWSKYNQWAAVETFPAKHLDWILPHVEQRTQALDLGAGTLKASHRLVTEGFAHVDAVDLSRYTAGVARPKNISVHRTLIEDYAFPNGSYDLIHAKMALPYVADACVEDVFSACVNHLTPGGVFYGNFFGPEDEPVQSLPMRTTRTMAQVLEMLRPLWIISKREYIHDDLPKYGGGSKKSHIITFLAKHN